MQYNYDESVKEMHILAYIYHWGRNEIRHIPRTERVMWVNQIIEQKNQENEQVEKSMESARSNSGGRF